MLKSALYLQQRNSDFRSLNIQITEFILHLYLELQINWALCMLFIPPARFLALLLSNKVGNTLKPNYKKGTQSITKQRSYHYFLVGQRRWTIFWNLLQSGSLSSMQYKSSFECRAKTVIWVVLRRNKNFYVFPLHILAIARGARYTFFVKSQHS